MLGTSRSRTVVMTLATVILVGCSSMQQTPMMPTYPAKIGGYEGVTPEVDNICRQQAYQAADQAKQQNATTEVISTAVGAGLGAVVGNAVSPSGSNSKGPKSGGSGKGKSKNEDYTGAGALVGGTAGAAASQGMVQNTQQVYDITYNNCIASYSNTYRNTPPSRNRGRRW